VKEKNKKKGGLTPLKGQQENKYLREYKTNHHINHIHSSPWGSWAKAYMRFANGDIILGYR